MDKEKVKEAEVVFDGKKTREVGGKVMEYFTYWEMVPNSYDFIPPKTTRTFEYSTSKSHVYHLSAAVSCEVEAEVSLCGIGGSVTVGAEFGTELEWGRETGFSYGDEISGGDDGTSLALFRQIVVRVFKTNLSKKKDHQGTKRLLKTSFRDILFYNRKPDEDEQKGDEYAVVFFFDKQPKTKCMLNIDIESFLTRDQVYHYVRNDFEQKKPRWEVRGKNKSDEEVNSDDDSDAEADFDKQRD